jgi:hypothetical protein
VLKRHKDHLRLVDAPNNVALGTYPLNDNLEDEHPKRYVNWPRVSRWARGPPGVVHLHHDNICEDILEASRDGEAYLRFQANEGSLTQHVSPTEAARVFAEHKVEVPLELIDEPR